MLFRTSPRPRLTGSADLTRTKRHRTRLPAVPPGVPRRRDSGDRPSARVLVLDGRSRVVHSVRYIESIHRPDVAIDHLLMIDLAILGLLTEQELHGYELKKRLSELWSRDRKSTRLNSSH